MSLVPSTRAARLVIALVVGVPLVAAWSWTIQRVRSSLAASAALDAGRRHLADNRSDRAFVAFAHARDLAANDPTYVRSLWTARARLAAEAPERINADNLEDVRFEAEYLLESDRANAAVYHTALANVAQRTGDAPGALARLDQAIAADPNDWLPHAVKADLLMRLPERLDDSIEEWKKVTTVAPGQFAGHFGLGRAYQVKREPANEIAALNAALALRDDYAARLALGDALYASQKVKEAAEAYLAASRLNPAAPEPHWALGQLLVQAGSFKDAEAQLRLVARMAAIAGTKRPGLEFQLGVALARQNRCGEAQPLFIAALRESPNDVGALLEAGGCAEQLQLRAEAAVAYQKILALQPPSEKDPQYEQVAKIRAQAQKRLGPSAPPPDAKTK